MSYPKLYISYVNLSMKHEELVLQIATDLRESGVDVIWDKWDAKPIDDAKVFMETTLSDSDVKKIIIISDRVYAENASDPKDGENQIITQDIYEQHGQEKFAVVIAEKDEEGNAFVPNFYRSGIFIDLSEEYLYSNEFDKLLRWVYDKPLYAKPKIGEKPVFLDKEINLGTHLAFKKALDAVKNHRSTAKGRIDEYLTLFTENLERFRITEVEGEMDETIYKNIESFNPFKNEYVRLLVAIAVYSPGSYQKRIQRFIEDLIAYTNPTEHSKQIHWGLDNFMFISHEIFLYTLAVFLKYERFDQVAYLLSEKYLVEGESRYGRDEMITFDNIHRHIESLEKFNEKFETVQEGPRAHLLKSRCPGSGIDFKYLMQADFTAFLKAELEYYPYYSQWYAETLMFLEKNHGSFEIYTRANSRDYFNKMRAAFGIDMPADLSPLMIAYEKDKRELPRGLNATSPSRLANFKALATLP